MERLHKLLGPRIPAGALGGSRRRYALPTLFLGLATVLLVVSIVLPYWHMKLLAPQYPGGLHLFAYIYRLTGDVAEIDGLNHYIGMRPLGEAAHLERSLSIAGTAAIALLVLAAVYVHNRYAALLAIPALLYPAVFLGDLYYWLRTFGLNLDPHAALSSSVEPFVPTLLGTGRIGQFATQATPGPGLYLAAVASVSILAGLYFHRRTYKPLVEAQRQDRER